MGQYTKMYTGLKISTQRLLTCIGDQKGRKVSTKDKKIQHEIVDYLRKGARAIVKYAPNRDTFERTTWRK